MRKSSHRVYPSAQPKEATFIVRWMSRAHLRQPMQVLSAGLISCLLAQSAFAQDSLDDNAMDCLIEPWVTSNIGSPIPGVIASVLVDRGDQVRRGQAVAQLESGVERSVVNLAEARASLRSETAAREAELSLAKSELDRLENLHEQKLVPDQLRDEAIAQYQIANAALTQSLENSRLLLLELERSRAEYQLKTLRSPIDGVVVSQEAFAGEFVYDNPVVVVAAIDPLRVEVMLPSRMFGSIVEGGKASVYPELGDNQTPLISTIDVVDQLLDTRSGTFGVRLVLENSDLNIPAGQRCRIVFEEPLLQSATGNDQ